MLGLLFLFFIFLIGLYIFTCFVHYRIVQKFDDTISFPEMLIPFWNIFVVDFIAFGKPYAYYYFWISLAIVFLVEKLTENYLSDSIIMHTSIVINALCFSVPIVFIAEKLGKNMWVYFLLMIGPSVIDIWVGYIITMIATLILAFDKSKPIPPTDEKETTDTNA